MAQNDPFIGQRIGNYLVLAPLGAGTYGAVYQARHYYLQERLVAIKILHLHLITPSEQEQFLQEATILEKLQHSHILPLLDVGIIGNSPYQIIAYAAGGSLRQLLRRNQALLPWEMSLRLLVQLGQALHYAHMQQIIHRDLKPENILLSEKNEALLADFGIASVLSTASIKQTTVMGTPAYMAPEQFQGVVSAQSDQYALACIGYELLTGHTPFSAPDIISMGFLHNTKEPTAPSELNPHVPPHVEQAILKALAKKRHERYSDMAAFIMALCSSPAFQMETTLPVRKSTSLQVLNYQIKADQKTADRWEEEGWDYYQEGMDHDSQERFEASLYAFEQALRRDPRRFRALAGKGDALCSLGRYEEALAAVDQSLRLNPDNRDNFKASTYGVKGNILVSLGRYEKALATYEQALQLDPMCAATWIGKGNAYFHLRRYAESLVSYEQALQLDPDWASGYVRKGDMLMYFRRYREAVVAYEQALRLNPDDMKARNGRKQALDLLRR